MFFKFTNRNAYRDLLRNSKKIALSSVSADSKFKSYVELYKLLKPKLFENERVLNSSPAFSKRCEHWNQRDVSSIKTVKNAKNPWLTFKKEYEQALSLTPEVAAVKISKSLMWFSVNEYVDDWIVD